MGPRKDLFIDATYLASLPAQLLTEGARSFDEATARPLPAWTKCVQKWAKIRTKPAERKGLESFPASMAICPEEPSQEKVRSFLGKQPTVPPPFIAVGS